MTEGRQDANESETIAKQGIFDTIIEQNIINPLMHDTPFARARIVNLQCASAYPTLRLTKRKAQDFGAGSRHICLPR
jgi:hypothetical protein